MIAARAIGPEYSWSLSAGFGAEFWLEVSFRGAALLQSSVCFSAAIESGVDVWGCIIQKP